MKDLETQTSGEVNVPAETIAHCKSCNTPLHGKYCYVCGQRTLAGRFTLKSSLSSFFSIITNVDRGLWHTMIWLFTKPHILLKDVLGGATARYFHPFRYLFLFLTVQVFLLVSVIDMEAIAEQYYPTNENAATVALQKQFVHVAYSYNHIFISATLPFLALAYWLVFGRKRYHYGEQLIITAYSYGQTVLIGIFLSFLYLTDFPFMWISLFTVPITLVYLFYVNIRFFKGNWFKVLLKTMVAFFIYSIFIGVLAAGAAIAYFAIKASTDPEFLNQFKQASSTA